MQQLFVSEVLNRFHYQQGGDFSFGLVCFASMAQGRVTDYFSQSKRAGVDRSLRLKSQKAGSEDRVGSESSLSTTRPQRSRSSAHKPLTSVQEEFLRLIDEAVSAPDHAEDRTAPRGSDKPGPPESPRTPKRTSTEAQFDLCSAVFPSATEQHSTAKKRLRIAAVKDVNTVKSVEAGRRTARKKLVLSKHEETGKVKERYISVYTDSVAANSAC